MQYPFSVGDVVYLSDNSRLGEITAKGDGTGITIGGGTQSIIMITLHSPTAVFAIF